jgi:aspartate racemase
VRDRLGGLHSARLLLHSVDFAGIERLQREDRWDEAGDLLADAARGLARAGAEAIVLCTNTMHRVAPAIEAGCGLPLLHIGDAIGTAVRAAGLATVGLLGTRFTMEQDFLRGRLSGRHGIDVRVPDDAGRALVHRAIYEELCRGRFLDESRAAFRDVMADLAAAGAQGIVLGCTEIGLLVRPEDASVPLFDTTALHAAAAVDFALAA